MDTAKRSKLADALSTASIVVRTTWPDIVKSWIYVPLGLIVILYACLGITSLVGIGHVSFPASVAVMILLFLFLLLCDIVLGDRRTRKIVKLVDIPGGFALRYINALFCPAFVLIPLAPPISSVEVGKIIAVFVIGYLVVFAFTAYLTRGLIFLFGISKRAMTERAEELGQRRDSIPLTELHHEPSRSESQAPLLGPSELDLIQEPSKAQDPTEIIGAGGPPVPDLDTASRNAVNASMRPSKPKTRAEQWAASIIARLDLWTYAALFFLVGLPVYFAIDYAMPAQLTLNVLCYFAALALPAPWRRIAHPAIVASILTIVGIYILAMCHGEEFTTELQAYQTKTNYLQVLVGQTSGKPMPGAGDVLGSVLQVSIVALALPMYQNRQELKRSFFPIVVPSISIAIASLFGYPFICHAIGINPVRSLAFPSRSLTLALATPATVNLGGDLSAVAVLCILSGIVGVVIGPQLLSLLRVPEDDYITRGVTLGANSSAIATALLLVTDPRAAAFSSLAMGLFGTITVAFTSIPAIAQIVKHLAGL